MTLQEKMQFIEEIMDVDEGSLEPDMSLDDVDEWDSLSVLSLTVEMKKRYKVNLTTDAIRNFRTVQDICDIIPD